jgi:hypothetical protein
MSVFCDSLAHKWQNFLKVRFNLENPTSVSYEMLKNAFLADITSRTQTI